MQGGMRAVKRGEEGGTDDRRAEGPTDAAQTGRGDFFFVVTPISPPPPRTCLRLQMELNVNDFGLLISLRSLPPGREFVRNLRRRFAPQPLLEGLKS